MIVRCPQCQYANKVEVEASKPRIVCARCATVISVEFLSSYTPTQTELASDESPEQLFMQTPESSPLDIDSLLDGPETTDTAPARPVGQDSYVNGSAHSDDDWDTDEILDIPRAPQTPVVPPAADQPLKLDDVLTPISADAASGRGIPIIESSDAPETPQTPWQTTSRPEVIAGEVVDDESAAAKEDQTRAFGQDSYDFRKSTFVMVSPDRRKSRMVKIFVGVGLFFGLCAFGVWALKDSVMNWIGKKPEVATSVPAAAGAASGTAARPAETAAKTTAAPSVAVAAPAGVPSIVPSAAAPPKAVQPSPSLKPTAPPATPKPVAQPQAGAAGHAVGAGEGSIALQFASYKSQSEAQQMATRLKAAGVDARIVKAELPGKGTWYRVQGGRFANEGEASKFAATLKAKGTVRDFIVTGYQNQ